MKFCFCRASRRFIGRKFQIEMAAVLPLFGITHSARIHAGPCAHVLTNDERPMEAIDIIIHQRKKSTISQGRTDNQQGGDHNDEGRFRFSGTYLLYKVIVIFTSSLLFIIKAKQGCRLCGFLLLLCFFHVAAAATVIVRVPCW